jgi:hypothetical protein
MTKQGTSGFAPATPEQEAPIPFKQFLESVHPSVEKQVSGLWTTDNVPSLAIGSKLSAYLVRPDLRLHCQRCDGERTFRDESESQPSLSAKSPNTRFINYLCGDCREEAKSFSLSITVSESRGEGMAYKHGEKPPFGVPVPNNVLDLFGDDKDSLLKGRRCENQGLGVGAFAYYRRVVENHKNEIFDAIIDVCKRVGASKELVEQLGSAKTEIQFANAMAKIKTLLPQGLLITGHHNPLTALHSALSVGLHNESDAKCLEAAQDVRLVLTELVERMAILRRENKELQRAVQRLIEKKNGA